MQQPGELTLWQGSVMLELTQIKLKEKKKKTRTCST